MTQPIDILAVIKQISVERKIDVEEIMEAIKDAVKTGFRSEYDIKEDESSLDVDFDPVAGSIAVYVNKEVVEEVFDDKVEISLEEARGYDESIQVGEMVQIDITPEGDFGRIAAQTARQVILQKLRESEKESAITEVKDKIGRIDSVIIQKVFSNGDVLCEFNRAKVILPAEERVPNEFYRLGSRIKVLFQEIKEDAKGKYIQVSRSSSSFLAELFRVEVPEIDSGTVEIVSIAREAGSRSKVAVRSNSAGVDPLGSCIGQRGVRIIAIMNELKFGVRDEKIDVILWDEDAETYIPQALQPAETVKIEIISKDNMHMKVFVPTEQLSLAIGKEGQNVRLASKLTGWKIDVESAESLVKVESKQD